MTTGLMTTGPVVIVGAGQGGFQAAASLRDHGHTGPITLVDDQDVLPYQRPPLSKTYLCGPAGLDTVVLRPQSFYDENAITLVPDRAEMIDRTGQRLLLRSGDILGYEHLVLATGATAFVPPLPGVALEGVITLRTLADADELRRRLQMPGEVVIIGGGFIGMEIAAAAATTAHPTTVLEALPRVMARVVTPELSAHVAEVHARHGTHVLTTTTATALHGVDGRVRTVELGDGRRIRAGLVVVGVGIRPETLLAERAGLALDNGVAVDASLRTSDPAISAIGDCASFPSAHAGRRVRLESVQNTVDQARHLAARLADHDRGAYTAVPWFWTHQFDLNIQTAGIGGPTDQRVTLGDPGSGRFSIARFTDGRLVCVESVNRAADHTAARKLLTGLLLPSPMETAAPEFSLKQFAGGVATAVAG
jgi:3-phenylpropionate/trans-cinnamate dioxygenase ferredoxin reductase subunit